MKSLKYLMSLVVIISLFILSGCGYSTAPKHQNNNQKSVSKAFPLTLKDATGTSVTLKTKPKRIVSLVPSNTETAFAVGAGKQVVGVTDNDDYPAKVKTLPSVGGMQLNTEKIISLKPDLVLAQQINDPKIIHQLQDAGIKVFTVKNPTSLKGVYQSILTIGKLTGHTDKAKMVNTKMKDTFNALSAKAKTIKDQKEKSVWVEISGPPEIYTTGKGTFMNELLSIIHAKNVAGSLQGFPKVSEEQAISYKPDVIVLGYGGESAVKQVEKRAAWQTVPAVKKHQIYTIDPNLISRPGPRLAKGAKQLAKDIYPGIFK